MKSKTIIFSAATALLLASAAPPIAEAKIACKGRYQVSKYGLIATPYCEDNYLAAIAGYNARAVRQNPHVKYKACKLVGHDPRVYDICLEHFDSPNLTR